MKVELEISWIKAAKLLAVLAIGIAIGYGLCTVVQGEAGCKGAAGEIDYLKSSDLNRSDIQASILLSRFCEGLGLQSSVYWQQDAEGNVFGTPICLQPQQ